MCYNGTEKSVQPVQQKEEFDGTMKKKLVPVLVAFLLILVVAAVGIITMMINKYTPSEQVMEDSDYYGVTGEEVAVVLQDQVSEQNARMIDGRVYLDYETVSTYLNPRFYWDQNEEKLLYTTPTEIITIAADDSTYRIGQEETTVEYIIFKTEEEKGYLALEFVKLFTDMEYQRYEDPNKIVIQYKWGDLPTVTASEDTYVRYRGGIKSDILTQVLAGTDMLLLKELEDWYQVATEEGYIGYVQKKDVFEAEDKKYASTGFAAPEYTSQVREHKINLAWHQVTSQDANNNLAASVANAKGLNTISPTWFSVTDNQGNISSLADPDYVALAHEMGLEVWGLIDNFNTEVSTLEVLSRTSVRQYLIDQLIQKAQEVGLDGINLDFESITEEEGPHFIQFVRELSITCRKNELVLSIDNPVPQYTSHYNRKEQGIVADYVIIMGYDEHFNGSEEAGSVASISFFNEGIEQTLEEVPAEKVIGGVPFYTRLWRVSVSENVTSEVMGMDEAAAYIAEKGIETFWDKSTGQNYGEYEAEDATYKIWLEDEQSLEERMKLIQNYQLAGAAAWKLGFERNSVWDVISGYLNE